ncbi:hypothetical protein U9M48_017559 [Paspalum notatum var. saurae]|uniref:JmjC domain-containing protein n=1 Tax=Paspalum notatum var. saurae TaxID=547442 RepID=A0AAQ3T870_PASNO
MQVSIPFFAFIQKCKSYLSRMNVASDSSKEHGIIKKPDCTVGMCSSSSQNSEQVSIMNAENKERCSLEVLKDDIQELLCGLRRHLHFYTQCLSMVRPPTTDYSNHARARHMKEYSESVILNCGDVLFIPEGWYHQVDSDDLTIAVNFWWKSRLMTQMLEHMDAYYIRRVLSRLVDKEMSIMVQKDAFGNLKDCTSIQPMDKALAGFQLFNLQKGSPLQNLEPSTLQALYELISLVHNGAEVVNQNDITESTSQDKSSNKRDETTKIAAADDLSLLYKDPVAKIILLVKPLELRSMLLAMVQAFPRTLEALVLNMLGPVGAEILTRKFDEMDQQTTKEEHRAEFYKTFYSVFEDQYAAMDALLSGKESFSFQVFQNVIDKYLRH